jgi:PAS domain S-box-containing protein
MRQSPDVLIRKIKRLEKQLARQADYRAVVEKNPVGISIIKNGRFIYINRKFRSVFGIHADDENRILDIVAEDYRKKVGDIIKHVRSDGSRSIKLEFKCLKKENIITCLGIFSPILFDEHPCVQLIIRDITRRNKLEEEIIQHYRTSETNLKRLEALYKISDHVNEQKSFKYITEKMLDFCLNLTDAASGLVSLKNLKNNRFETVAIVTPDNHCKIDVRFPPFDHILSTMPVPSQAKPRIFSQKDIDSFRLPEDHFPIDSCMIVPLIWKRKFTGFIALANNPKGFSTQDEKLIKAFANHINIAIKNAQLFKELKSSYSTLKNTELKLIQSEKIASVGLLAAGIAHEFNNIMSNISLYAQLATIDPDSKDSLVEVALTQSMRAMKITKSLLTFSKRREGILEYIDLTKVVEDVIRLTRKEIDQHNISIKKIFSPVDNTLTDTATIQQVFLNMIINAKDAIGQDGSITITIKGDGQWVYITFEDDGCGIAKENMPRIFAPFFTTKNEEESGSGLGLYVCYNITREAGGDIQVESKPGKGTKFLIRLPIREERRRINELVLVDRRTTKEKRKRYKILAVDGEQLALNVIKKVLEQRKHNVWITSSGEEAIKLYKKKKFDYVILDILISGPYNGFKIFKEIKKINKSTKIIFLTEKPEELGQYTDRTEKVLKKPLEIKKLISAIV